MHCVPAQRALDGPSQRLSEEREDDRALPGLLVPVAHEPVDAWRAGQRVGTQQGRWPGMVAGQTPEHGCLKAPSVCFQGTSLQPLGPVGMGLIPKVGGPREGLEAMPPRARASELAVGLQS